MSDNAMEYLHAQFRRGYCPMDAPPGIEEREYARWKAEGGTVDPPGVMPDEPPDAEHDLGVPPLTDAQAARLAAALKRELAPVITAIEDVAEDLADNMSLAAASRKPTLREQAALVAWEWLCRGKLRDFDHHADYETLAREAWQAAAAFVAEGQRQKG